MRVRETDTGFTLVELMMVVLIIGILVAIAIPTFNSSRERSMQRACFSNQRIVEGAAQAWSSDHIEDMTGLAGVVTGGHLLISDYIFRAPPRCPAAPEPGDPMAVAVATGAFTLDASGNVVACTHGSPAHGRFQ